MRKGQVAMNVKELDGFIGRSGNKLLVGLASIGASRPRNSTAPKKSETE